MDKKKFYIYSTYGELLDVALYLQNVENCEVVFAVPDHSCEKIGDGLVKKDNNWFNYVSKGYIWVVDGCENGELQDYLRTHNEAVFGNGGKLSEELENDRRKGQDLLKKAGFNQPESH